MVTYCTGSNPIEIGDNIQNLFEQFLLIGTYLKLCPLKCTFYENLLIRSWMRKSVTYVLFSVDIPDPDFFRYIPA